MERLFSLVVGRAFFLLGYFEEPDGARYAEKGQMLKNLKMLVVLGGAMAALLCACASWRPVAYSANASAVTDPDEDFERLVRSAKAWRPTKIEMHDTFAVLVYVGAGVPGGVHTVTVPFHEIDRITLLAKGDDFAVRATDSAGNVLYEYIAMNEKYARNFADVLAALKSSTSRTQERGVLLQGPLTGELRRADPPQPPPH